MAVGRRAFLRTGAAAAAAAALGPAPLSAQGKGPIRLAYLQLGWAATEIIHKEDLLGKRGWQAEYSIVPGAPGPLLNQLASKNVDAIDMSFALAAKAFEDGVPLKVTGVATAVRGAIVARKDAGLARVEDLRGRKIAAVVGTSTFFDIRALTLKGYGLDLQKDTQIVTATAPPDMVTLLGKKDVDAIIAWQPITDAVVFRGEGVYLAKQIDLWRKATGRPTGFPVHVCYLVHGEFLQKHPTIARDLNDAQKDAVEVWYNKPARAMEIVQEVTKLPADVVQVAHRETVRMLYGLPDGADRRRLVAPLLALRRLRPPVAPLGGPRLRGDRRLGRGLEAHRCLARPHPRGLRRRRGGGDRHGARRVRLAPGSRAGPRRPRHPERHVGLRVDRDLDHLVRSLELGADLHDVHDHAPRRRVQPRRGRRGRGPAAPRDGRRLSPLGR